MLLLLCNRQKFRGLVLQFKNKLDQALPRQIGTKARKPILVLNISIGNQCVLWQEIKEEFYFHVQLMQLLQNDCLFIVALRRLFENFSLTLLVKGCKIQICARYLQLLNRTRPCIEQGVNRVPYRTGDLCLHDVLSCLVASYDKPEPLELRTFSNPDPHGNVIWFLHRLKHRIL